MGKGIIIYQVSQAGLLREEVCVGSSNSNSRTKSAAAPSSSRSNAAAEQW